MDKTISDFSIGLFTWQALFIVSFVLWIYCMVDILKNSFANNNKIVWLLIVVFVPFIGSILYLTIGKNQKTKLN